MLLRVGDLDLLFVDVIVPLMGGRSPAASSNSSAHVDLRGGWNQEHRRALEKPFILQSLRQVVEQTLPPGAPRWLGAASHTLLHGIRRLWRHLALAARPGFANTPGRPAAHTATAPAAGQKPGGVIVGCEHLPAHILTCLRGPPVPDGASDPRFLSIPRVAHAPKRVTFKPSQSWHDWRTSSSRDSCGKEGESR